ncbi:hypothetical protein DNI29_11650 [Hymenobacter sediminis]|uniref:hypothetical protein n=1 Tax=Hymenobacter sediminis TaxID=2218621 RepID=UPI000DA6C9CD|nr:hypothetical protein [Hymenobacter sediminis]RPD46810.1 hypothetical protein DNI29_11650 [Hymenobacter sediminis]
MAYFTRSVITVALAGGGLALGSCSRDSVPTVEEKLVGRWEWQQTETNNHKSLTPENTGHRVLVEFDRRGRARFYQDGQLVSAAAFSVRRVMNGFGRSSQHVIIYRGYQNNQYYSISGNRLHLQDASGKISGHTYIRAAPEVSVQVQGSKAF